MALTKCIDGTRGTTDVLPGMHDYVRTSATTLYSVRSIGLATQNVRRWTGTDWADLGNASCNGFPLVTAGTDGLVLLGCNDADFDLNWSVWLNGSDWEMLAPLSFVGHIGGRSGTAVFFDEAAGNLPTYDGAAWSTLDASWTGDRPIFVSGPSVDTMVAQHPGHVAWRRAGVDASLDDARLDRVDVAVVTEDRLILSAGSFEDDERARYTFDCEPE